jgi:large subunit ribosomal protein L23
MELDKVLLKPMITEKTTTLREKQNKYVFIVDKDADKITIARAVKEMFDVTPVSVNVINCKGKKKRVRYKIGTTASKKKAIITLKQGDKIGIFEGV